MIEVQLPEFFYKFVSVKQLFKYLLNTALATFVLLMSVGVSYSSISCSKVKNQKSCCALEQISCCSIEIIDNCCYEETVELQFDFDTPIEKRQEVPDFLPLFTETLYSIVARCVQSLPSGMALVDSPCRIPYARQPYWVGWRYAT